ncbi:MAG: ATP-binding protein [Candidatus Zixiibacteriota bacterium]
MPPPTDSKERVWAQREAPTRRWGPALVTTGIAASVLVVLFILYAVWGVRAIRGTLIAESERNGIALVESILLASEYSVEAALLTDRLAWENLATRARLTATHVDENLDLTSLMRIGDAEGIALWRGGGPAEITPPELARLVEADPLFADPEWNPENPLVGSFLLEDSISGDEWIGAGLSTAGGGLIIWELQRASENLPAWSSIGQLIQQIGRRSDINYIMLQSPDGIVFASRPLPPVLSLADDQFLVDALDDTVAVSREIVFEDVPVLEVVKPFLSSELPSGMFRVGISLSGVFEAQRRLSIQLGLSALLFLLLALVGLSFVVARRSYSDLSRSYARVETLTHQILDSMDQAVMAVDTRGRLTVFNRAAERLFGRIMARLADAPVDEVLGAEDYRLREVAAGGNPSHNQEARLKRGDRSRELVYSTTPVVTADGLREGAVTVVRDETDSRAMADQVERSRRLSELGNLAAGVAHEIRNPLNAIALAAQRLRMELTDSEARDLAGTVVDEARRLNGIVEDFLSLARSSTQPRTTVDCAQLVEAIAGMASLEAAQRGINWELTPKSGDCRVSGIPDELRKAIWNVMSNAISATPEGGRVAAAVARMGERVRITVQDSGRGINKEDLPRIFEPYFTTREGGTGLGLAITHRIVTDHGGTIRIESPPPNADKGTMAVIEIPATPGAEA